MGQTLWGYLEEAALIPLNFLVLEAGELIPADQLLGLQRALHDTTNQRWPFQRVTGL